MCIRSRSKGEQLEEEFARCIRLLVVLASPTALIVLESSILALRGAGPATATGKGGHGVIDANATGTGSTASLRLPVAVPCSARLLSSASQLPVAVTVVPLASLATPTVRPEAPLV